MSDSQMCALYPGWQRKAEVTALGCKVIATASTSEKRQVCVGKAGVDHAVDYTKKDWQVGHKAAHRSRLINSKRCFD